MKNLIFQQGKSINLESYVNCVFRKMSRKRISAKRRQNETVKQRGRPKKIIKKPICIVRPMVQSGNENKPKKCGWSNCSHMANSVRSLKMHVENDHLNHLTQYACRWISCSRSSPFKALYMLSLHLRSHIGIKPFECSVKFKIRLLIMRFFLDLWENLYQTREFENTSKVWIKNLINRGK